MLLLQHRMAYNGIETLKKPIRQFTFEASVFQQLERIVDHRLVADWQQAFGFSGRHFGYARPFAGGHDDRLEFQPVLHGDDRKTNGSTNRLAVRVSKANADSRQRCRHDGSVA